MFSDAAFLPSYSSSLREAPKTPNFRATSNFVAHDSENTAYKTILKTLRKKMKKHEDASTSSSVGRPETAVRKLKQNLFKVNQPNRIQQLLQQQPKSTVLEHKSVIQNNNNNNNHNHQHKAVQVVPKMMEMSNRLTLNLVSQDPLLQTQKKIADGFADENVKTEKSVKQSVFNKKNSCDDPERSPSILKFLGGKSVGLQRDPRVGRPTSKKIVAVKNNFTSQKQEGASIIEIEKIEGTTAKKIQVKTCADSDTQRILTGKLFDQNLLAYSSTVRMLQNAETSNINKYHLPLLVLPVEFVIDEFSFWKQDAVNPQVHSAWKRLNQLSTVVWVIRRESTLKSLNQFCRKNNMQQNAVFLLEKKKKSSKNKKTGASQTSQPKSLCVNYCNLLEDLDISHNTNVKLHFVNVLYGNSKKDESVDFDLLENKLPLIRHHNSSVHLLKTAAISNNTLSCVQNVISQSDSFSHFEISRVIRNYCSYINNWIAENRLNRLRIKLKFQDECCDQSDKSKKQETEVDYDELVLKRMDQLKRDWITNISAVKETRAPINLQNKNTMLLTDCCEPPKSIHYLVGDLLKRNYHMMLEFAKTHHRKQSSEPEVSVKRSNTCGMQSVRQSRLLSSTRGDITMLSTRRKELLPEGIQYNILVYLLRI